MENHLLEYIAIKDFKCFKDFKAEGFKRVNLIGGKNNVGKTAFMEACYVNVKAQDIKNFVSVLRGIKFMRENLNILADDIEDDTKRFIEQSDGLNIHSNINEVGFDINEDEGKKLYNFKYNYQYISVNVNDFSYETDSIGNIEFIDNFGQANFEIKENYSSIQKKDREVFLNKFLNEFDERIESFKIIEDLPQCKVDGEWFVITELGDGVRHLISIIAALFHAEDGYLFIDEIDNGIHYTQLDRLWEIILTISKEQNVQVFATTHSKECIESYARVSKKLEESQVIDKDDICFIELGKNKENELDSIVYNYDMIQSEIKQNHEIRGW